MCLVKLAGVAKLMPACNVRVAAKMEVETASAEVQRARRDVMQFLMLNHPVDCGICDKAGECRLQDHQYAYGAPRSRSSEPKHHKRKLHDLTPRIQLDNERCILCSRCVRFTREISRTNPLGIVERGGHAYVERNQDADPVDALLGQRHRAVPHGRAAVARFPVQEPRLVSRAGALGLHRLRARLQRQSVAAQEGVAAALGGRGSEPRDLPGDRVRQSRHQRAVALQQGLRPAQDRRRARARSRR